jgi:histone arginine demethylase JMJD6
MHDDPLPTGEDPMTVEAISIDRRSGLDPDEFRREYYEKGRPVILTDASRGWRAHGVITPDWLRKTYGTKKIEVGAQEYALAALLDLLEAAEPGQPTPYPCTLDIPELWPELLPLVDPLPLPHARPNRLTSPLFMGHKFGSRTEAFFGGRGGNFPYAHTDYYHLNAWITMIFGRKEFWVFATEKSEYMYPEPPDNWRSRVTNIFEPDYDKFPLFRNVKPTRFEVGPGETLFIPAGTWHSARSLSLTMSVAFDQLNAKNMPAFTRDILSYSTLPLSRRIAYAAYFTVLGQVATLLERSPLGR